MRGWKVPVAVIILCALGSSACSSGSHASRDPATQSSTSSSASSSAASTTTGAAHAPDDVALAKSAVLRLADLPPGWTAEPHRSATSSDLDARIAACLHVPLDLVNTDSQPHADSADFFGPSGQNIQSGVAVFGDATLPTRWIQLYATPLASRCTAANLGAIAGTLHPGSLPLPRIGDGTVGIRYSASNGNSVDVLFARRGRALAFLAVLRPTGIDEPALLGTMTKRLSAAA